MITLFLKKVPLTSTNKSLTYKKTLRDLKKKATKMKKKKIHNSKLAQ